MTSFSIIFLVLYTIGLIYLSLEYIFLDNSSKINFFDNFQLFCVVIPVLSLYISEMVGAMSFIYDAFKKKQKEAVEKAVEKAREEERKRIEKVLESIRADGKIIAAINKKEET